MAFHLRSLAVAVLCLIFAVQSSSALKCIQCSTDTNPKCNDLTDPNIVPTNCVLNQINDAFNNVFKAFGGNSELSSDVDVVCYKGVIANGTATKVERSCIYKRLASELCEKSKEALKNLPIKTELKYCGTCDKDGCNGASSIQYALPLLFIAPFFYAMRLLA